MSPTDNEMGRKKGTWSISEGKHPPKATWRKMKRSKQAQKLLDQAIKSRVKWGQCSQSNKNKTKIPRKGRRSREGYKGDREGFAHESRDPNQEQRKGWSRRFRSMFIVNRNLSFQAREILDAKKEFCWEVEPNQPPKGSCMLVISRNASGLGNPLVQAGARSLLKSYKPDLYH